MKLFLHLAHLVAVLGLLALGGDKPPEERIVYWLAAFGWLILGNQMLERLYKPKL